MTLIGLCGYAGSGKDSVAEILVREHGFKRYAFADKLRELAYELNPEIGINPELGDFMPLRTLVDSYGWDYTKRNSQAVRELLQRVGMWHREQFGEDFWVSVVRNKWLQDGRPAAVVTDVRFPNEARFIRAYDGKVARVVRPGVGPINGHASERLDFAHDIGISNDGGLDDLARSVGRLTRYARHAA